MNRDDLVRSLLLLVASGRLDLRQIQPVLGKLLDTGSPPVTGGALLEALEAWEDPAFQELADRLREARRKDALQHHALRSRRQSAPQDLRSGLADLPLGVPLGWQGPKKVLARLQAALRLLGDRLFLADRCEKAPRLAAVLEKRCQEEVGRAIHDSGAGGIGSLLECLGALERQAAAGDLEDPGILDRLKRRIEERLRKAGEVAEGALARPDGPVPRDLDQDVFLERLKARFLQTRSREERLRLLDLACAWPTDRAASVLPDLDLEPWEQERATLILTLRFGQPALTTWDAWCAWLCDQADGVEAQGLRTFARERPLEMIALWYSCEDDADRGVQAGLERLMKGRLEPVIPEDFAERWSGELSAEEHEALTGRILKPAEAPPVIGPDGQMLSWRSPEVAVPQAPAPPRRPPAPSIWDLHLKPFFLENWYMAAGVVMVLVGSSLLAYYTWDKHWLIRYTLMPALLGAFTAALARLGGWIERRDAQFKGTAAVLRGAAIGLLPVNFMAVALLANDPQVSQKGLAVPLMGLLYLAVFGWGLRRWCAAVHEPLGGTLGGTLLLLNALVTLAPLATSLSLVREDLLLTVVGAGFYLGFFALAAAVVRFSRRILTAEMAKEKRVVWFFGAALAVTFVQVFAWVHGYLHHFPRVHTYAAMVVLAGWLVLYMERRTLALRGEAERHGAESFLGFAFVLLGVLMGIGHPIVRILTFVLAGVAWIYQALPRRPPLHAWIGLTFVVLGGASVGLLRGFPPQWLPALGIGLALALGLLATLARREAVLSRAAAGMQASVLILTVLVTVLAQWHYDSPPLAAAAGLAAIAALFGVRAWRDRTMAWVQTAMVVLALTLPYLGGFDWTRNLLHSTALVFGLGVLSFLWIGLTSLVTSDLLLGARSTVLWIYGVLAVACMAIRGSLGPNAAPEAAWIDLGGPLLMTAALLFATYFSRSLVPAAMALVIDLILLPALKTRLQAAYPQLGWGSGLGSSVVALLLVLGAFALRRSPRLANLDEGDRYMGTVPYPIRRHDHTLFTWPMIAGALFLAVKVETWNFLANLTAEGVTLKVAAALGVTGVVWTLLAVYGRKRPVAPVATWLGLAWMVAGLAFACPRLLEGPHWTTIVLVPALFVQALFFFHRFAFEPRGDWAADLLTGPTRWCLRLGSVVFSIVMLYALATSGDASKLVWLALFLAAQLAWHGLTTRRVTFGFVLFGLVWLMLLAWTAPGRSILAEGLSDGRSLATTLWLILAVQVFHVVLEWREDLYESLRPLVVLFQAAVAVLALVLGGRALALSVGDTGITTANAALLLAGVALTARALSSGPYALLGAVLAYLLLEQGALRALATPEARIGLLLTPWRVSLLAFAMAALAHAGRIIHRSRPAILSGRFTPRWMRWPVVPWLFIPAGAMACAMALYHTANPALRESLPQLWSPYLGAATLAVIAFSTGLLPLYHAAGVLLSLGNVHLVRVSLLGEYLRAHGLTEIHLIGLGIALTLLTGTAIRLTVRREEIVRLVNRASLVWAGLILALISANYLVHPNLEAIPAFRFGVSGAMAFLAGWYFRSAARRPAPGEGPFTKWCEGLYHFGVTMALWCAALMVPALRHPITALVALGLPVLYFYARAESGFRRGVGTFERYRASAATLGFVVLALYVFRGAVQMIIFPEVPFETAYYHQNAPVVLLLGIVLLRLHALGGTSWLAFYGGLAVIWSAYFAVTALPGLSPFDHPVPSAWCAIALAHFFTLASLQRSPIRTAVERLADIDARGWTALRRPWGRCLLVASQGMALWGISDFEARPRMVAPLLLGAASVLIHQGLLKPSRLYHLIAAVEIAIALHADFLLPSYLPKDQVVWALLGIWAALVVAHALVERRGVAWDLGPPAAALAALTLAHVFYHHPGSSAGLRAVALGSILAALTRRRARSPESEAETIAAATLLFIPAWLVWFSQAPLREEGLSGAAHPWPVLATVATLFATGALARLCHGGLAAAYARAARLRPRLFDQTIAWMGTSGATLHTVLLWWTFLAVAMLQAVRFGTAFAVRELALLEGLYAALFVAWIFEGRARRAIAPYFLMEACVLGAFLAAREQILATAGPWRHEYDVWASLAAFFVCFGALQVPGRRPRELLIPLQTALLALPAFSVTWVALHHLGTDRGLLVVGLHSAAFAYLGKDDRQSPYHLVSIGGLVSFVLLLFWSKLHLTVLYAYVVPVGIGLLVLLQLFRERVPAEIRNGIRAVTMMAMVGSAGWYALTDPRIPLLHNLVVVVLCLGAMALGGFLKIRMYAALGFASLTLDVVAILVKAVAHMERSVRMTLVGSTVLLAGAALVFGAIYYKTHRRELAERLEGWRRRSSGWE